MWIALKKQGITGAWAKQLTACFLNPGESSQKEEREWRDIKVTTRKENRSEKNMNKGKEECQVDTVDLLC